MDGVRLLAIVIAVIGAIGMPAHSADGTSSKTQPNVLIFLADDLGWGDLGCYGHPSMKTPNLDRFAGQGVRFTQCYAACGVCSPPARRF